MKKIPYKPGDVLVNRYGMEFLVQDLSKNELVCFLKDCSGNYSFEELEETGLKLKSSKEEYVCDQGCYLSCTKSINLNNNCGKIIMPSTPWRPKMNENYFSLNDSGTIYELLWLDLEIDNFRLKSGNCFRTREEAEEKLKEIMEREV